MKLRLPLVAALTATLTLPLTFGADLTAGMSEGNPKLASIGPLAFGENGILFAADSKSAAIVAIATGDTKGVQPDSINISKLDDKIAALLGTTPDQILINDLAVNPASGSPYLAVSRGRGPEAKPALIKVKGDGSLELIALDNVHFSKAILPDAPADGEVGEGRRRKNPRMESITDIAFTDGDVIVAGLSNEEFASSLRRIPFPFKKVGKGTSIEIYHGAHGKLETRSPVRTFASIKIGDESHLLAAYTCTPLVHFPLKSLKAGAKIRGTTLAELGNRNRPLDMIVYADKKGSYLLIANNARGVMKVPTADISKTKGIDSRISGTAGLGYETIKSWVGIEQLDAYNESSAIVIQRPKGGGAVSLTTKALP